MKYLNTKTGCIEEPQHAMVIEQYNKRPDLYKPVVGVLEEAGQIAQGASKKPRKARKKAQEDKA